MPPKFRVSIQKMMLWVAGLACVLGPTAWLTRAVHHAREAARRSQCVSNLKQIALALHNYQSLNGAFPPAYTTDSQGRPMHSWRVLILPFMEQSALYNAYNFNEPWDGPNNRKLVSRMPVSFACPSHRDPRSTHFTNYVAVVGPRTVFPGSRPARLDEISDRHSDTVILVEVCNADIPWTKPQDLEMSKLSFTLNNRSSPDISSRHGGRIMVAFVDGSIRLITGGIAPENLRALLTKDGGEPIDRSDLILQ